MLPAMLWVPGWFGGCLHTVVTGVSVERRVVMPVGGVALVLVLLTCGYRLNPDLKQWLAPQPVMSSVALVVGFILLSWQLRRQHENAMRANSRQTQERLKLELYNKIAERIEATRSPLVAVSALPTSFVGELTWRTQVWSDTTRIPESRRLSDLGAEYAATSRSIILLMSVLETHAVVMPDFSVFRDRLSKVHQQVALICGDFSQAASAFAGSAKEGPIRWPPSAEDMKILSSLAAGVRVAGLDAIAVVWDLRVEAQNYLLGDLFGRKVPAREPRDPTSEVTRIQL